MRSGSLGNAQLVCCAGSDSNLQLEALPFDCLILDFGGVLVTFSEFSSSPLSADLIRTIFRSSAWFQHQEGKITEEEMHRQTAAEIERGAAEVAAAFVAIRSSLRINQPMMALVRAWKKSKPSLRIYLMSNISHEDWEFARDIFIPTDLTLFDKIFTSASAGRRKPCLNFYRDVIDETRINPKTTLYVDDTLENVVSARSFGFNAPVFKDTQGFCIYLEHYGSMPISRALSYLSMSYGTPSVTSEGTEVPENFAELLVSEAACVTLPVMHGEEGQIGYNYYPNKHDDRGKPFPNDLDTTSIALTAGCQVDPAALKCIMDEMLEYVDASGIAQVYFDKNRPRIDPVVCVNILSLFHTHGRGDELAATFEWIYRVLETRAYVDGTQYYKGGNAFLYFTARLAAASSTAEDRLGPLLRNRVVERFGAQADSVSLAMRVATAARLGFLDSVDYQILLSLQEADGSWPVGWVYRFATTGIEIGNKRLTTAIAIQALRAVDDLCKADAI